MVGVLAAVVLGVVLVFSGGSKLAAPATWRQQATEFGASPRVIVVLPWTELVLGAVLVAQLFRPWAAVAAGVLVLAFTATLVRRLRAGRRPPCACFGARSTRPISWWTVARNACLVGLAVVAAIA